jgi:hypothetical protein
VAPSQPQEPARDCFRLKSALGCSEPATLDLNLFFAAALSWTKPRSRNTLASAILDLAFVFRTCWGDGRRRMSDPSQSRITKKRITVGQIGFDGIELGLDMKFMTGLLAVVLLIAGVGASHAVVRIADDRGGRIGTYVDKYQGLRTSGEYVIIDGLCASACTIVLGAIPHDKICVTSHATLGFHAAWDFGANGRAITNPEATQMLYSMYPSPIRHWISQRGGLTPRMIFLHGRALQALYKPCYLDAQASPPSQASPSQVSSPSQAASPSQASLPSTTQAAAPATALPELSPAAAKASASH